MNTRKEYFVQWIFLEKKSEKKNKIKNVHTAKKALEAVEKILKNKKKNKLVGYEIFESFKSKFTPLCERLDISPKKAK